MAWRTVEFDDSRWEDIHVPAFWETQGHKGYDGYGWYRVKFRPDPTLDGQHLVLFLGKIDDVDEVYLNGDRVGKTGTMGKSDGHEYQQWRTYTIPGEKLLPDRENVLAVRVFDKMYHGGIYNGPIGLVSREKYLVWQRDHERMVRKKPNFQRFLEWLFE
jgi:sialate O-acetylesterase